MVIQFKMFILLKQFGWVLIEEKEKSNILLPRKMLANVNSDNYYIVLYSYKKGTKQKICTRNNGKIKIKTKSAHILSFILLPGLSITMTYYNY